MLQESGGVEAASEHVRLSDVLPPVLACASSLPEWLTNSTGIPTPELTQCANEVDRRQSDHTRGAERADHQDLRSILEGACVPTAATQVGAFQPWPAPPSRSYSFRGTSPMRW